LTWLQPDCAKKPHELVGYMYLTLPWATYGTLL